MPYQDSTPTLAEYAAKFTEPAGPTKAEELLIEAKKQLLEDARYMGKYAAVSRNPGNPFFDSQILAKKIGKYLGTVIEDKK